jgi:hypothetical protein
MSKKTTKPAAKPTVKLQDLPAKKEIKGGKRTVKTW